MEDTDILCAANEALTVAVVDVQELAGLRWPDLALVTAAGEKRTSAVLGQLAERAKSLGGVVSVALVAPLTLAIAARGAWTAADAQLLRRVLSLHVLLGSHRLRLDVRVAAAVKAAADTSTAEALLRQATIALPKRGVAVYDGAAADAQALPYQLVGEVRRALQSHEFVVHYQPKFDLFSGEVVGSEALIRWQHPIRGLLPPVAFLPAVDIAGAGRDLALYVIRQAVEDASARAARGLVGKTAVNLAAEDLRSEQLVDFLCDPADRLWTSIEIELTEGSMADADCLAALQVLATAGFAVALDDFGTRFSSLSALHVMPLAAVKIDRSFVQRLPGDLAAEGLIGAVTSMCRQLGITVIAEGIETPNQASAVRRLGCASGQGYLFSRPLPLDEHQARRLPTAVLSLPAPGVRTEPPAGAECLALAVQLREEGASTHTIAAALNQAGYRTPTGTRWHPRSVARALATEAPEAPTA